MEITALINLHRMLNKKNVPAFAQERLNNYFSAEIIKNIGLRSSSFISGILINISSEGIGSLIALILNPALTKALI